MVVDTEGGQPEPRPIWLVVATHAPTLDAALLARPGTGVRIITDPESVAELLRREQPRLAIVELPDAVDPRGLEGPAVPVETRARVSPRSTLPVADGFELDIVGRELRHDRGVVHLRPREFQLLATLAADPGRAFTRGQLMTLAWGTSNERDPRTVDVHVHWLRSKIEPQPERPTHLVTVRGFGYRLDPSSR